MYLTDILLEVSSYAPRKLREMEDTISKLKKSTNNKQARLDLIRQIKEFTKISEVVIFFDDEFNVGVITVYKKSSFENVIKSTFKLFSERINDDKINPNKLKDLANLKEPADMIQRIYIFIGKPLLKILSPSEMVAVLLHEFGHVFSSTSSIPDKILNLLYPFTIISGFILKNILQYENIVYFTTQISILYMMAILGILHGITFTQRIGETKADNYTVKYGYGDELIFAINKFTGNFKTKNNSLIDTFKNFIKELFTFLKHLLIPSTYTHPNPETRIKNLENQIFNMYKKLYPQYKEGIELVHADYVRQGA